MPRVIITEAAARGLERCRRFLAEKNRHATMRAGQAIERIRRGRSAQSILMLGLRGVGKTVLLDQMRDNAEAAGFYTLRIEAPERLSLPALIAPELRVTLLRLSKVEQAKAYSVLALRALAGFATALKVKFQDIEWALILNQSLVLLTTVIWSMTWQRYWKRLG